MNVICKKSTTRLVKGLRYEVEALYNSGTNGSYYLEGKVWLKGFGRFAVNNFTDTDGKELPKIDIPLPTRIREELLKFSDLEKGDILVCTTDGYKTLVKDGMYRVEDLTTKSTPRNTRSGTGLPPYVESFVKLEGIKRKLKFSSYRFRKLSTLESREIALNKILLGETEKVINSTIVRKIDLLPNKQETLVKILCKSILDPMRHQLSITDWGIQQVSKKIDLLPSDFSELMDMPLKDILRLVETN
jgi:hypothetical protein